MIKYWASMAFIAFYALSPSSGSAFCAHFARPQSTANGGCEGGWTVKNGKKGCKPADGRPENVDKLRIRNAVRIPWGERAVFSA